MAILFQRNISTTLSMTAAILPNEFITRQLAEMLEIESDYLLFLAGRWPSDLREMSGDQEDVTSAMKAFRRSLSGKSQ